MSKYPLYDSTFTLYRVSPLFHGNSPLFNNLDLHVRRLRDNLKGDTFHSTQITEGQTLGASSGSLKSCTWDLLGDEAAWARNRRDSAGDDEDEISMAGDVTMNEARGVHIQLEYEQAKHSALLLGNSPTVQAIPGFTFVPLLLVRMPVALRETVIQYLTTAFDARISPMRLRSGFLGSAVEKLLDETASSAFFQSGGLNKGLQMQLSFPSVSPMMRSLDISLTKDDIEQFTVRGVPLWQEYRQRTNLEDRRTGPRRLVQGPFTAAFSAYLDQHISLSLDNPAVILSKVVCGPFALAGEGKVKVLESSAEAIAFWDSLIEEAEGTEIADKLRMERLSPGARQIGQHDSEPLTVRPRIPTEPPPPYELHDPAMKR